jgi:hypothetical protein
MYSVHARFGRLFLRPFRGMERLARAADRFRGEICGSRRGSCHGAVSMGPRDAAEDFATGPLRGARLPGARPRATHPAPARRRGETAAASHSREQARHKKGNYWRKRLAARRWQCARRFGRAVRFVARGARGMSTEARSPGSGPFAICAICAIHKLARPIRRAIAQCRAARRLLQSPLLLTGRPPRERESAAVSPGPGAGGGRETRGRGLPVLHGTPM